MLLMIAVIKYDRDSVQAFRIYDTEKNQIREIPEQELVEALKKHNLIINNLGLNEEDKIVGTQGSIDRYATLGVFTDINHKYPIVVINKVRGGYTVVDCAGNQIVMSEAELIKYAKHFGVANAKVVTKGKTEFISAISGTFELVGGRLSDDLISQWERLQALKQEGKLSENAAKKLDTIENDFERRIDRLRKSELRNKLSGPFDIARMYNLIMQIAEILDEVDIDRVDEAQRKVSKQYKEVKALVRAKKKSMDKEKREKYTKALRVIGNELRRTIKYVDQDEMSSDECVRRFEVIGKHLGKLKGSLDR